MVIMWFVLKWFISMLYSMVFMLLSGNSVEISVVFFGVRFVFFSRIGI